MTSKKFYCYGIYLVSFVIILLGLTVLFGWHFGIAKIVQIHPSFAPMQYNTALCFILSGLSLFFTSIRWNLISVILGFVVFLTGLLTILEYFFIWNIGIDELFMKHYIVTQTSHSGRMAANSAFCFSLVGFSLMIWPLFKSVQVFIRMIFGSIVLILGLIALVGYVSDLETAYGWGNFTKMSMHTAFGFIFLGTGLMFLALRSYEEIKVYFWLPPSVFLSTITIFICFWMILLSQEQKNLHSVVNRLAREFSLQIQERVKGYMLAQQRFSERREVQDRLSFEAFEFDAKSYISDNPSIQNIMWINPEFHIEKVATRNKSDPVLNEKLILTQDVRNKVERSIKDEKAVFIAHKNFLNGLHNFYVFSPIVKGAQFEGVILFEYLFDELIQQIAQDIAESKYYQYELAVNNSIVYKNIQNQQINNNFNESVSFELLDNTWIIEFWPTEKYINSLFSSAPTLVIGLGFIIASILAITSQLAYLNFIRSKKLQTFNETLEKQVEERTIKLKEAKTTAVNMMVVAENAKKVSDQYATELKESREELQHSFEELEQFTYIVSHDLKEPLRTILSYGDIILKNCSEKLNNDEKKLIEMMIKSTNRMRQLIEDLLEYSRITKSNIDFEKVNLNDVIKETLSDLQVIIEEKKPEITIEKLPIFWGNPIQIRQLFQNLIGNSLKFVKNGTVPKILVSCEEDTESIKISLKDNGIGIKSELIETAFKPFRRLKTEENYSGSGIGLAICKKIVDRHYGKIVVESKVGKGSTFTVILPKDLEVPINPKEAS